jgi:hypothetical protein
MTQASFQRWSREHLKFLFRMTFVNAAFDRLLESLIFDERLKVFERCLSIQGQKGLVELAKLIREIRKEGAVLPPTPENINKVKKV